MKRQAYYTFHTQTAIFHSFSSQESRYMPTCKIKCIFEEASLFLILEQDDANLPYLIEVWDPIRDLLAWKELNLLLF